MPSCSTSAAMSPATAHTERDAATGIMLHRYGPHIVHTGPLDRNFGYRLGTYRYLDTDVTIREAMDAATATLARLREGVAPPACFLDPLG